ncbi:hypothetical protein SAMN04489842_3283 [Natronobacterium texcoconense]|uniref:Uncharacterized protein n=1 Tax=Natronobacterium texcoconense TaxID=1095778 RepID=A0A1H1I486_NATTX|nr:hypothetical protein SAMN04489842_3283 [Natronobacterium texcoconense]
MTWCQFTVPCEISLVRCRYCFLAVTLLVRDRFVTMAERSSRANVVQTPQMTAIPTTVTIERINWSGAPIRK